jgi:hypothetical protein
MFDSFGSTAGQVRDALRVIASSLSTNVLQASNRTEVVNLINASARDLSSLAWFDTWIHRFSNPEHLQIDEDARGELSSADAIIGWTASNSLRRASISPADTTWATALLVSEDTSQIRWRAAHFLGAAGSDDAVDSLFRALDNDAEEWVRYGALRSLVEIAANSDGALSERIIVDLSERSELLSTRPRLARELEKTLPTVSNADEQWMNRTERLVVALWASAESVDEQDRWSGVGRQIRERSLA